MEGWVGRSGTGRAGEAEGSSVAGGRGRRRVSLSHAAPLVLQGALGASAQH